MVPDTGTKVSEDMLAWAHELQVGNWFMLDHNGRVSQVQFVWRSDRKQLHLFASSDGRSFLIQVGRLASYLQAGLLVPAEEETLTVRATREALAKLDANPERLLQLSGCAPRTASRRWCCPGRWRHTMRSLAASACATRVSSHSSSSTSASGSTPVLQCTISTMIFSSSSATGSPGVGHGAVDHDLAHAGRQHAGDSRKLMKPRHSAPRWSCSALE